jgi:hypothetical protein
LLITILLLERALPLTLVAARDRENSMHALFKALTADTTLLTTKAMMVDSDTINSVCHGLWPKPYS